jgi:hypothetical protein
MIIQVTQKDIDKGLKSSCYECPIALAFKRKVKNQILFGYAVNYESIDHFTKDNKWYIYALPKKAQTFIKRFDGGKPVEPFTFEIEKDLK